MTIGMMTGMMTTKAPNRRSSLRFRVVTWTTLVVFLTLCVVVILTRAFSIGQVIDNANRAVEQEAEEFNRFASEGLDPATGAPFASSQALIETYLSRQIPTDDEVLLGFVGGQMLQLDYSSLSGNRPEPIAHDDPLVHEILHSAAATGVSDNTHWARVSINDSDYFTILFDTSNSRDQVTTRTLWISLISTGGLLASIVLAWMMSGQITAPLKRLQQVASSISNSDLTKRVPVESNDEIGQLATTFNAMLDRIETAYRDQRKFVDDAGHELRTPITVVRGQLELLPHSSEEDKQKSIELCMAELDRMARMVNDMLTLTVADSDDFVRTAPVDLGELTIAIDDKATTLNPRAQLVEVAEGEAFLDAERITQAVLELVSNALRYSTGPVELGSTLITDNDERLVRFWVRDHGAGIPEEERAPIFERFSRSDHHQARAGGAGLGLSIVHAIGQAHGGRAYVDSTVGLGSVFGIEVPLSRPETFKETS
ncbi:sensor histidine kinase [Corynebacterium lubricantis]|uniref:sensor histidine kinase n=1 Tax=Corynebacterium lubricantis TaxID=541095 RepID=UPI001FE0EC43|nr:ATP-binding protein [Corynebacterium lubricantis]